VGGSNFWLSHKKEKSPLTTVQPVIKPIIIFTALLQRVVIVLL